MRERGLEPDGTIAREGSLDRVGAVFIPVVEAVRAQILRAFDGARLHSAYLYGSIPRGTAVPGVSDLDVLVLLTEEPVPADRAEAKAIEASLDRSFPQVDGAGIEMSSARSTLGDLQDGGFFVACLCTPLLGTDLAGQLPRYRPTGLLARETNGDLALVLPEWRRRLGEAKALAAGCGATSEAALKRLSRLVGRRLVRTGFTLVMPRWNGWTSDLEKSAEIFGRYYPARAGQMHAAASTGRVQPADPAVLTMLVDDLGEWLAGEYARVHGVKASRS